MLSLAPWMVPVGIIGVSLFLALFMVQLDNKTSIDGDLVGIVVVVSIGAILMALGSLITILVL